MAEVKTRRKWWERCPGIWGDDSPINKLFLIAFPISRDQKSPSHRPNYSPTPFSLRNPYENCLATPTSGTKYSSKMESVNDWRGRSALTNNNNKIWSKNATQKTPPNDINSLEVWESVIPTLRSPAVFVRVDSEQVMPLLFVRFV